MTKGVPLAMIIETILISSLGYFHGEKNALYVLSLEKTKIPLNRKIMFM